MNRVPYLGISLLIVQSAVKLQIAAESALLKTTADSCPSSFAKEERAGRNPGLSLTTDDPRDSEKTRTAPSVQNLICIRYSYISTTGHALQG